MAEAMGFSGIIAVLSDGVVQSLTDQALGPGDPAWHHDNRLVVLFSTCVLNLFFLF